MSRTGFARFVVLLAAASVAAQESPDVQARRLLEDGRTYWAQGKLKQALDNFQTVVTSFPQTPSVGLALLEIGRYRMEVEGDLEKARVAFEQVSKQYAQSEGAPGAYYYLGRLTLARAVTAVDLDDALAQLTRVHRLYPTERVGSPGPRGLGAGSPAGRTLCGRRRRRAAGLVRVPELRRRSRGPVPRGTEPGADGRAPSRHGGVPSRFATGFRAPNGRTRRSIG